MIDWDSRSARCGRSRSAVYPGQASDLGGRQTDLLYASVCFLSGASLSRKESETSPGRSVLARVEESEGELNERESEWDARLLWP